MIVPTSVECVTNFLYLKAHLIFNLEFTLVAKHTHGQHVRSLSLTRVLYVTS